MISHLGPVRKSSGLSSTLWTLSGVYLSVTLNAESSADVLHFSTRSGVPSLFSSSRHRARRRKPAKHSVFRHSWMIRCFAFVGHSKLALARWLSWFSCGCTRFPSSNLGAWIQPWIGCVLKVYVLALEVIAEIAEEKVVEAKDRVEQILRFREGTARCSGSP